MENSLSVYEKIVTQPDIYFELVNCKAKQEEEDLRGEG